VDIRLATAAATTTRATPAEASHVASDSDKQKGTPGSSKKDPKHKEKKVQVDAEANKTVEEIRQLRLGKVEQLRSSGLNPYAYAFERTDLAAALHSRFANLENGSEVEGASVAVAGRVLTKRVMGKLAFVTLRDDSGTIQLYVDTSRLQGGSEDMKLLKSIVDAGDFLGVRGGLRRTDRGELSVIAYSIEVCSPSCFKTLRLLAGRSQELL
jgi:lysyl-tRNA synthetase, class II